MQTYKMPREQKNQLMEEIREYFYNERSEEIGHLAAENILDFFLFKLTPIIYNQGISDALGIFMQRMVSTEEDLYALKKSVQMGRDSK